MEAATDVLMEVNVRVKETVLTEADIVVTADLVLSAEVLAVANAEVAIAETAALNVKYTATEKKILQEHRMNQPVVIEKIILAGKNVQGKNFNLLQLSQKKLPQKTQSFTKPNFLMKL